LSSTLWVLNPNTTLAMTDAVVAQVRARVPSGVEVRGVTAVHGAAVIDSRASFAAAADALPALVAQHRPQGDGLLLACFGDPGLEALRRSVAPQPVAGLAEAAVAFAVASGRRFAILTAGPAWVSLLTERVADFGAAAALTGVHALPVNGRELAAEPELFRGLLCDAARVAEHEGAQALILGGAAFAGLAGLIETSLPVIDAIDAATDSLVLQMR
jgi:Asp/Glu/hydantoin racemase